MVDVVHMNCGNGSVGLPSPMGKVDSAKNACIVLLKTDEVFSEPANLWE